MARKTANILTAGVLMSGMAACGSGEAKPAPNPHLRPDRVIAGARCASEDGYTQVPQDLAFGTVAKILGTTVEAVRNGLTTEAHCTPPITGKEYTDRPTAVVSPLPANIGSTCLLFEVQATASVTEKGLYSDFSVICPQEVAGTPGVSPVPPQHGSAAAPMYGSEG